MFFVQLIPIVLFLAFCWACYWTGRLVERKSRPQNPLTDDDYEKLLDRFKQFNESELPEEILVLEEKIITYLDN